MKPHSTIEQFAQSETPLHFVIGVSGFIMKELTSDSATVFCWEDANSASEFIWTKFTVKQKQFYEVCSLDKKGFDELRHTIKFLPDNAVVNVDFYQS